ncbi:DUF2721 domain-containing protein [Chitinivibrio alkaliphilus]|uniref:DUF2721 domain-containing protein n=1 Tax=Chitinivibrio alkaliphilus ACht1 TaxID=1313304 RepID=U7DB11_9BACT|nr:DUF2721 domain-containing protein [Chitinivibrio alkaliphilus]ERP39217.1 hypothetical protein CALK_0002 [Chitinivibrio alkaliphilus ACht1]
MHIDLTTPALLFPAISLLLLAYTNRFLVLAQLVRELVKEQDSRSKENLSRQIENLGIRLRLIRIMQLFGVISFFLCTLSMVALFIRYTSVGNYLFGLSLLSLLASLVVSMWEIAISTRALRYELSGLE